MKNTSNRTNRILVGGLSAALGVGIAASGLTAWTLMTQKVAYADDLCSGVTCSMDPLGQTVCTNIQSACTCAPNVAGTYSCKLGSNS